MAQTNSIEIRQPCEYGEAALDGTAVAVCARGNRFLMIIELNLGMHRKVRIWQGELPAAYFDSTEILFREFAADVAVPANAHRMSFCIEYKAQLGGRTAYGLLGSTFHKNDSSRLMTRVLSREGAWRMFDTDFSSTTVPIFVGLPTVFAESVLNAMAEFHTENPGSCPPGQLTFDCAAYSEIGSSQHVFEQLAIINCRFFCLEDFGRDGFEPNDLIPMLS